MCPSVPGTDEGKPSFQGHINMCPSKSKEQENKRNVACFARTLFSGSVK